VGNLLEHDFRSDVGYWVHVAAHRFERAMNAELAGEAITYRQCQVLAWLALEGDSSQVKLARCMNVEPPTLVRVLDCMERDGLIERTASESDRRSNIIRPTPKAVPMWKRILACAERVNQRSNRGLSEQEVQELRRLLQIVHDNLGDAADAD
jgi:MarR family transcriptional regulator for hemolysin